MPLRHLIVLIADIHSPFVSFFALCKTKRAKQTKYQQKRPASRDIFNGAVKLPIISKGFEHSLATQCFFGFLSWVSLRDPFGVSFPMVYFS